MESGRSWVHILPNMLRKVRGRHVAGDFGAGLAATLNDGDYGSLVLHALVSTGTALPPVRAGANLATNVGRVVFNVAGKWAGVRRAIHGVPDTVHEEQGALVREAGLPLDLQSGHALLRGARGPECKAPVPHENPAVLHDGPDADGELTSAATAAPQVAGAPLTSLPVFHHVDIKIATTGARRLPFPAHVFEEFDRCVFVGTGHRDGPDDVRFVARYLRHFGSPLEV